MNYFLLNKELKPVSIATTDSNSRNAFSVLEDTFNEYSNAPSTLELTLDFFHSKASEITEGAYIVFDVNGSYKLLQIKEVEEEHSSDSFIKIFAEESSFELLDAVVLPKAYQHQSTKKLLGICLADTDWGVGNVDEINVESFEFGAYETALASVQKLAEETGCMLNFRVRFSPKKGVTGKFVDLVEKAKVDEGKRLEFGRNINKVTRKVDRTQVCTAVIPIGENDLLVTNFDWVNRYDDKTISKKKEQYYLEVNEETRRNINPNSDIHLFYALKVDTKDQSVLCQKAYEYLKNHKEPKYTYEVEGISLRGIDYQIGEQVKIIDDMMNISLVAEVEEKTTSFCNPDNNSYKLTNYIEKKSNVNQMLYEIQNKLQTSVLNNPLIVVSPEKPLIENVGGEGTVWIDTSQTANGLITLNKYDTTNGEWLTVQQTPSKEQVDLNINNAKDEAIRDANLYAEVLSSGRELKILKGETFPTEGMVEGQLFIHTGDNDNMYRWNGTDWVLVGVSQESFDSMKDELTGKVADALQQAEQAKNSFNEAKEDLENVENELQQTKEDLLATQGELNTTKTNLQNKANELTNEVNTLKTKTQGLEGSVSTINTELDAINGQLDLTATKTEVENMIDGIEIGGRNLITNSHVKTGGSTVAPNNYTAISIFYSLVKPLEANKTYTFSSDVEILAGNPTHISVRPFAWYNDANAMDMGIYSNGSSAEIIDNHIEITFSIKEHDVYIANNLLVYHGVAGETQGNLINLVNYKLEEGNIATAWTPAPEDTDAKITQNTANISVNAERIESVYSELQAEQTAQGNRITQAESNITQNAKEISSKVSMTEVTNAINNIEIGGRNLIPTTDFGSVSKRYERLSNYTTEGGFWFTPTIQVENDYEYTLSLKMRGHADVIAYEIYESGGNVSRLIATKDDTDTFVTLDEIEYQYVTNTFKPFEGRKFKQLFICTRYGEAHTLVGDWFEIAPYSLKLEKGNKATDWTPAPEDLEQRVTTAESQIVQHADMIASKVSQSTYDTDKTTMTNRIASAESNITQNANMIASKVGMTEVTNAINNLQIGGRNLWVESDTVSGYTATSGTIGSIINSTAPHRTMQTLVPVTAGETITWQIWNPDLLAVSGNSNRIYFFDSEGVAIEPYILGITLTANAYRKGSFVVPANATHMRLGFIKDSASADSTVKIKVEKGNKATDWTPAPEDTQFQLDSQGTRITSAESSITQLATEIQSKVSQDTYTTDKAGMLERIESAETTVTQTANSITSVVQQKVTEEVQAQAGDIKDEILGQVNSDYTEFQTRLSTAESKINQNSDSIALSATKTELTTYATRKTNNLILNGYGEFKDNTNFTNCTYDASEMLNGNPSFKYTGTDFTGNNLIPVDITKKYRLSAYVKTEGITDNTKYRYAGFKCYDIDGNFISPSNFMYINGSTTTLAQDLNNGDTVVHLTSVAGFNKTSTHNYHRGLIFWNYANSAGYVYENYSRNIWYPLWDDSSTAIDTTNNTITLKTAWNKGTIPAGTKLSQSAEGSTFVYTLYGTNNHPTNWTYYSGVIDGVDTYNTTSYKFRPATAFIKFSALNYAGGIQWFNKVELVDITDEVNAKAYADEQIEEEITSAKAELKVTTDAITANVSKNATAISGLQTTTSALNTQITQNANAIALRATKTEMTEAIDNIKIGGRNLIVKNTMLKGYIYATTGAYHVADDGYNFATDWIDVSDYDTLTLTFYDTIANMGGHSSWYHFYDENKTWIKSIQWSPQVPDTKTFNVEGHYIRLGLIKGNTLRYKLEAGNKSTDYTLAPEDVENYTDSSVLTAKAEIKVTTDAITNTVSNVQSSVNGLTTRMSNAETKIDQKADSLTLSATKTELQNNINNIQVGGRNLIPNSTHPYTANGESGLTVTLDNTNKWMKIISTAGNWNSFSFTGGTTVAENELNEGDKFTISFDIRSDDLTNVKPPSIYIKSGMGYYSTTGNVTSNWSRAYYTGTWKDTNSISFHLGWNGTSRGTYYVRNFKLEKGNKPTDYTPAPEDVTSYTNSQINTAKAEIKVTTDAITNSVTKVQQNLDSTVTTLNSKIDQKADSITLNATKSELLGAISDAIGDIEIGGRNLLKNSRHVELDSNNNNYYPIAKEVLTENGREFTRITRTRHDLTPNTMSLYSNIVNSRMTKDLSNTEVTVSYMIRCSHSVGFRTWIAIRKTTAPTTDIYNVNPAFETFADEWVRISYTFTVPEYNPNEVLFRINPYSITIPEGEIANFYIDVCEWKVEEGNKATDWTPAPEDIENRLLSVENATLTVLPNQINSKVSLDTYNADQKTLSSNLQSINTQFTQKADKATLTALQTDFTNLAIGGYNFLPNADFSRTIEHVASIPEGSDGTGYVVGTMTSAHANIYPYFWGGMNSGVANATTVKHAHLDSDTFGFNTVLFDESDGTRHWKGISTTLNKDAKGDYAQCDFLTGTYTFSCDIYVNVADGNSVRIWGGFHNKLTDNASDNFYGSQFTIKPTQANVWQRLSGQCVLHAKTLFTDAIRFYIYGHDNGKAKIWIKNIQLEYGNKATAFDMGAENKSKLASLETRIKNAEIAIDSDSITQTVMESEAFALAMGGKADSDALGAYATPEDIAEAIANQDLNGTIDSRFEQYMNNPESNLNMKFVTQAKLTEEKNSIQAQFSQANGLNFIHNSLGFGGVEDGYWIAGHANLAENGGTATTNNDYATKGITINGRLTEGKTYRVTVDVTPAANVTNFQLYASGGYLTLCNLPVSGTSRQTVSATFVMGYHAERTPEHNVGYKDLQLYRYPNNGTVTTNTTVHTVKIEEGAMQTNYTAYGVTDNQYVTTAYDFDAEPYGFKSSFKLSGKTGDYVRLRQPFPTIVGNAYTVSFYYKLVKGTFVFKPSDDKLQLGNFNVVDPTTGEATGATTELSTNVVTDGYKLYVCNFIATSSESNVRFAVSSGGEAYITGIMVHEGTIPLKWSQATGEQYNSNILMDINGIKVIQQDTNKNPIGYTEITPKSFSGYYDTDGDGDYEEIFTLREDAVVTKRTVATHEIIMGDLKFINLNAGGYTGWALVPSTANDWSLVEGAEQ